MTSFQSSFILGLVPDSFFFFFKCAVFCPSLQEMTAEEKAKITDLKKCDFNEMNDYYKAQSEARKAMSKEQKLVSYTPTSPAN